jgi:hypothetical protein
MKLHPCGEKHAFECATCPYDHSKVDSRARQSNQMRFSDPQMIGASDWSSLLVLESDHNLDGRTAQMDGKVQYTGGKKSLRCALNPSRLCDSRPLVLAVRVSACSHLAPSSSLPPFCVQSHCRWQPSPSRCPCWEPRAPCRPAL